MEKLSGLVLDVYDDKDLEIFRSVFPVKEALPDIIKEAHVLNSKEQGRLPDDLFALVLMDDDVVLRKYACIDPGNTALSVEYFLKTAQKLPAEAQKLAAENLLKACEWYDIEPPADLQKIALGLGTAIAGALVAPGAAKDISGGLSAIKGTGGQVLTPDQVKMRRMVMAGGG